MLDFTNEEKIAGFDRLAECFFNNNFGTVSKADIELIMFALILKHLSIHEQPQDDYAISNQLGITQQRVRNLKVKCQIRREYSGKDWKQQLAELNKEAIYTDDDKMVTICLDDPCLQIEIQHYIESHGGFVDFKLNPKLLTMPTRNYAAMMINLGMEKNEKVIINALRESIQDEEKYNEKITKESMIDKLKHGTIDIAKDVITGALSTVILTVLQK